MKRLGEFLLEARFSIVGVVWMLAITEVGQAMVR